MPEIKLVELKSIGDFLALTSLRLKREQRAFTRPVLITYLQSRHPAVTSYRIEADEQLIGYVMLIHAENPTQWIIERLTIDREHQRQGYGYAVVDQLIDMIYGFENSEMVIARYKPENEAAQALFEKLNFVQREEMFRGRHIALLEFEFEEVEEEVEEEIPEQQPDEDDENGENPSTADETSDEAERD